MGWMSSNATKFDEAKLSFFRGLNHLDLNQYAKAEEAFLQSLALLPGRKSTLLNLSIAQFKLGKLESSRSHAEQALAIAPDDPVALYHLAALLIEQRQFEAALDKLDRSIAEDPIMLEAYWNRGKALRELGRFDEALSSIDSALSIDSAMAEGWISRGIVLSHLKRYGQAIAAYDRAISINPDSAEAFYNRGNALKELRRFDEALVSYGKAISLKSDFADAFNNRGNLLKELRRFDEALDSYNKAISIKPDHAEVFNNRGAVLQEMKRFDEALMSYDKAISLKSDFADALANHSRVLQELGRFAESSGSYERLLEIESERVELDSVTRSLLLDLYSLDLLPAAYGSEEELSRSFADLERRLIRCVKAIERSEFPSDVKRPIFNRLALNLHGFFTAYFQKNVVDVMKQYSKLLSHVLGLTERSVDRKRRRDGKIRLGIASGLLRSHNGVNWAYNWVSQLPNDYDFFTYAFNSSSDELTDKFSNLGTHRFLKFDKDNLQETIEVMKCDEIDILMLPDVGMTPESRILASHRIAPVQFTAWGHPVTTGSSNVDYFVSSDLMEPDDAQWHYSETLVRLPNLALFLTPSPSLEIGTQKFEFPAGRILFGCLQSIFKYLPQYDFVYPLIAKHVPQSLFVFLEAEHLYATDIFKERLLKEFVLHELDFHKHVKFLPRVSASNYIGLMSKMDVILDSIGWTGGNTSLQAIELGKPIVTVPGEFMRGRHTYAMLKMMGLDDHCSNSLGAYVDRAVALGSNGSLRTHVGSEILERKQLLYEDRAFIDAFDKFLKGALERHIPGSARVGE